MPGLLLLSRDGSTLEAFVRLPRRKEEYALAYIERFVRKVARLDVRLRDEPWDEEHKDFLFADVNAIDRLHIDSDDSSIWEYAATAGEKQRGSSRETNMRDRKCGAGAAVMAPQGDCSPPHRGRRMLVGKT